MKIHIDLETFSSVDIKSSGAYKYTESIDFEILLIAYAFDDGPIKMADLASGDDIPQEFINALNDPTVEKHAHNATFERLCFRAYGYDIPAEQWYCSAIKAAYCGLPLHLDGVSKALNLGEDGKLSTGKALIRYFCVPCKPTKANGGRTRNLPEHDADKWSEFKRYCVNDVRAERKIEDILEPYEIPDEERKYYVLDQEINDRGVLIDTDLARKALEINDINTEIVLNELKEITGVDNPNSGAQLKEWLGEAMGREVKSLAKGEIPALLESTDDPTVKRVIELNAKSSLTSIKKYQAMLNCACDDSRGHGLVQFYGANRTGRWSGRLLQLHNLKQNHLEDLQFDRNLLKTSDYDTISMMYEEVSDWLSQLIRTGLVAKEGHTLGVADFSAIEARVGAWIASEEWVLEVFRTHGKLYEATASKMFGVPLEEITKDSEYRAKGKVSSLALQYQGAVGALSQMGGEAMGMSESEMRDTVRLWRDNNPSIVKTWYNLEAGALRAIHKRDKINTGYKGICFDYDGTALTMDLPSGRKLFYWKPQIKREVRNGRERESIRYWGKNQTTGKWSLLDTYGGKLFENCLAQDTEILTDSGWKVITDIKLSDKLWDGGKWVPHNGVIYKGLKNTIDINGVRMTPDHKIYTNHGWKEASQSEGLNRNASALYDSMGACRPRVPQVCLENKVRLWKNIRDDGNRILKRTAEVMRMYAEQTYRRAEHKTRDVQASSFCCLAVNGGQMQPTYPSSMEELWRERYKSMRPMERLRRFLDGREGRIQKGTVYRQDRCERRLRAKQCAVGYTKATGPEQERQSIHKFPMGQSNCSRGIGKNRDRSNNSALSVGSPVPTGIFVQKAGFQEPVYDILNVGDNNRFLVKGENGFNFIVHNCVQAIARDLLAHSMLSASNQGFEIVLHVHDEMANELPDAKAEQQLQEMIEIMRQGPEWADGLPLDADGYITKFYKKD